MQGFLSQFSGRAAIAATVALAGLVWAAAVTFRSRRAHLTALPAAARTLCLAWVAVIVVATALPMTFPPRFTSGGDLELRLGAGGLAYWRHWVESPGDLAALLALGNVLLYVPLTLLASWGWRCRKAAVLGGALLLSVAVEGAQYAVLERIASTDDVLLNMAGAVVGAYLGANGLVPAGTPVHRRTECR